MGSSGMHYGEGAAQIVGGAALSAFGAPEIGIPLMVGGIGQTAGQGAGGNKGAAIGEMSGLAAGGIGEGFGGMGPLGNFLGGLGSGGGLGTGNIAQAAMGPAASQQQQLQGLAKAGFPGAQQMTGQAPPGSGMSMSSLMQSPVAAQLLAGAQKPQQPMMQPPPMPMGQGGGTPTPPQVQVPAPPAPPSAGSGGPLMAMLQKLMGGMG